ncbi:methylecgonone reductase-like isoform X2 [Macadamia integrifolia]|uniref:methylecgonone reductase-like isoform X2 n=1 Tax=Macadamia integrifolia TaxID=60698 RepID=UPI001C4E35A5|nr:methylecgonone reductase-like isoform X2 [Macadamia integrifolia]
MEKEMIPKVVLNSGHRMPLIGFGTGCETIPENLTSTLVHAIEIGYRHFDTASFYQTEEFVGQAIAQALERGLTDSRSDIFVTSKLWCSDADHDLVLPALKETLQKLGLDYVDLYLVHWPVRLKQGTGIIFPKEDVLPFDMKGTWEAMEECCRLGLAKSIGVSNFSSKKLSQLLTYATIPPAVNQVEMNPSWQQKKLRDFCNEKGIHVGAWSPLGAYGAVWGSSLVMENPILKDIALVKGKTIAKISLRWVYQQGAIPIVKSFNKERMKENLQIFDWELTQEEMDKISQIPQRKGFSGAMFISPNGPYKSLEELWDEEVLTLASTGRMAVPLAD